MVSNRIQMGYKLMFDFLWYFYCNNVSVGLSKVGEGIEINWCKPAAWIETTWYG